MHGSVWYCDQRLLTSRPVQDLKLKTNYLITPAHGVWVHSAFITGCIYITMFSCVTLAAWWGGLVDTVGGPLMTVGIGAHGWGSSESIFPN